MTAKASSRAVWWFTLDEFMARADRVLTSDIARREDLATVGSTMKLIASFVNGATTYHLEYQELPEAEVESAAARVRPLFLENDTVFHGKVTNAMGGLSQEAPPQQRQLVKYLKKSWHSHEDGYRWALAVSKDPTLLGGQMRTDRQIARDFLYGELVHADPTARRRLQHIPESERLRAAVVWVADATRLTQATKQLYIDLRDGGHLAPRPP